METDFRLRGAGLFGPGRGGFELMLEEGDPGAQAERFAVVFFLGKLSFQAALGPAEGGRFA